jgi:hypothetical protein
MGNTYENCSSNSDNDTQVITNSDLHLQPPDFYN